MDNSFNMVIFVEEFEQIANLSVLNMYKPHLEPVIALSYILIVSLVKSP